MEIAHGCERANLQQPQQLFDALAGFQSNRFAEGYEQRLVAGGVKPSAVLGRGPHTPGFAVLHDWCTQFVGRWKSDW